MTEKTAKTDFYVILASALLLVPVIFFPITTDLAIFIQAGEKIVSGGKPYIDFIDIKPPAIYYLYGFIYSIFGKGEVSIRLFDFIIQIITASGLYFLLKKNLNDKFTAITATLVYSISYTVLAHNQTMQIESWVPLLSILMIYVALKDSDKNINLILTGILAGILTALKTSMFFVVLFIPLSDYFLTNLNLKRIVKRFLFVIYGFLPVLFISVIPFFDTEIRKGFVNVLAYLEFYAKFPPLDTIFLRNTVKEIGTFFGDKFSLLFSFLFFWGLLKALRPVNDENKSTIPPVLVYALSILILLSLSIVFERKFFPYHFSRLYGVFAIFIAVGIGQLIVAVKQILNYNRKFMVALVLGGIFFLVMSPLPRFIAVLYPTVNYFADKNKYNEYYSRGYEGGVVQRTEQLKTAEYILNHSTAKDKVLTVSVASSIINYHLGDLALNKFSLSCFYISEAGIKPWQNEALKQLKRANWLVLQDNDINYMANGHFLTSRQYFLSRNPYKHYTENHFRLDTTVGDFYIYKRILNKE